MLRQKRGFTIIEVLVVVLILGVLVAVALPFYLRSVSDTEINACKTNMSSIAAAEQAQRVRDGFYWSGPVDTTSSSDTGPLRDLHFAVPQCPGDPTEGYSVADDGAGGFLVRCANPRHHFQWHNGLWEDY